MLKRNRLRISQGLKLSTLIIILMSFCNLICAEIPHETAQFLTLTDIHFDPFIACGTQKPCPLVQKLSQAKISEWDSILKKMDTKIPTYRQNTNYALLHSALIRAKQEALSHHVLFVVILGDFIGHNYRRRFITFTQNKSSAAYLDFIQKTFQFLQQEIKNTFPNLNVYMAIGNNDSYVNDYVTIFSDGFFRDLSKQWSQLLNTPGSLTKTFDKGGYYASDVNEVPNLRLVVLNSVLFSYKSKGKLVEAAALKQLDWFRKEIDAAQKNNKKILLVMHIPIGIDIYITSYLKLLRLKELWEKRYIEIFENILKAYPNQIMGILAGHLHSDWFEVLKYPGIKTEIPVTGIPSISPIYGNNPGFKIYRFKKDTFELENFITYYYSLNQTHSWSLQYDFNRTYQPECYHCSILLGMRKL